VIAALARRTTKASDCLLVVVEMDVFGEEAGGLAPVLEGVAEDVLRLPAHEQRLERVRVGFPDDRSEPAQKAVETILVRPQSLDGDARR